MIPLLADGAMPSPDGWGPVFAQIGVAAATLVYVGRYLVPRLLDELHAEREQAAKDRVATQEAFLAALRDQRAHDDAQVTRTHERIDDLADKVAAIAAK